jgi:hypothetical protein
MAFHINRLEQPGNRFGLPLPIVYEDAPALRWEYHVLTIDTRKQLLPDEARLNELGHEGWLLVGVLDQRETGLVQYIFARRSE